MFATTYNEPGDPDVLQWTEVADLGQPGAGEVLIDIFAAGVNNADLMQRQGKYPVPPGASPILGLECSGRIAAIGADVSRFAVGDLVCALLTGGGSAERVIAPVVQVLPVPDGVDAVEAAGLPETVCTVYSNVLMGARLAAGETLLVHGGGSGIGTFAIQWAAAIGARVITTAGSRRKLDAAAALGADVLIDYRDQDFVAETLTATDDRGADVILDLVGAPYLERNIQALATDGRIVLIGGDMGEATIPLGRLMAKRGSIASTSLRPRPVAQKAAIIEGARRDVWPLYESGAVRPVIDTILPIEQAADAHRLIAAGGTIGKVLLTTQLGRDYLAG